MNAPDSFSVLADELPVSPNTSVVTPLASPFVPLSQIARERVEWLWPGRIPLGAITVLEGDPGHGKSTITCDLAARVTRGMAMPHDELPQLGAHGGQRTRSEDGSSTLRSTPRGVVLIQAEDHLAATVLPRLQAAGADLNRVLVLHDLNGVPWQLPEGIPLLEEALQQCAARLVVIDPLSQFLGPNSHNDQKVRQALQPLADLAQRANVAVLLVRHLVKEQGRRAIAAGGGSIGIIGLARSALAVGPLPEPLSGSRFEHQLAVIKGNLGDAPALAYRTQQTPDGSLGIAWLGPIDEFSNPSVAKSGPSVLEPTSERAPHGVTRITRPWGSRLSRAAACLGVCVVGACRGAGRVVKFLMRSQRLHPRQRRKPIKS